MEQTIKLNVGGKEQFIKDIDEIKFHVEQLNLELKKLPITICSSNEQLVTHKKLEEILKKYMKWND